MVFTYFIWCYGCLCFITLRVFSIRWCFFFGFHLHFVLFIFSLRQFFISKIKADWGSADSSQYHIQTDEGPERFFRYQTDSGQFRNEKRLKDGTVIGEYLNNTFNKTGCGFFHSKKKLNLFWKKKNCDRNSLDQNYTEFINYSKIQYFCCSNE